jgi:hypothetical protein
VTGLTTVCQVSARAFRAQGTYQQTSFICLKFLTKDWKIPAVTTRLGRNR